MKKLNKFFLSSLAVESFVGIGIYISRFRICPPINGISSCIIFIENLINLLFIVFVITLIASLVYNLMLTLNKNKLKENYKGGKTK